MYRTKVSLFFRIDITTIQLSRKSIARKCVTRRDVNRLINGTTAMTITQRDTGAPGEALR
jgi:hypothetical protein